MKTRNKWILFSASLCSLFLGSSIIAFAGVNNLIGNNQNGYTNPIQIPAPIIKNDINFTGSLRSIITSDSREEDVNNNLFDIFNSDKRALLSNSE